MNDGEADVIINSNMNNTGGGSGNKPSISSIRLENNSLKFKQTKLLIEEKKKILYVFNRSNSSVANAVAAANNRKAPPRRQSTLQMPPPHKRRACAIYLNNLGKVIFPIILFVFTVLYFAFSLIQRAI